MIGPVEFHLPRVSSTNDYARDLLSTYPFVLVSAQHQTAGRGRKGREWHGDHGANVYCSIGIRHGRTINSDEGASYMALGALSVLAALRACTNGLDIRLKWPNDVQARHDGTWSKLAGILVDHEYHGQVCAATIVGIGVNVEQRVFPETIGQPCTSLSLMGMAVQPRMVLEGIRDAFIALHGRSWHDTHEDWTRELHLEGRILRIAQETGVWKVRRILSDGRLVVGNVPTNQERIVSDGDSVRYED